MQNDVYHRLHTINKKIYSVYYICESRIYGGPQLSRKNKICHGKIKFETTNSNYSRQTTNTHGKSKTLAAKANRSGKIKSRMEVSGCPSMWCSASQSTRLERKSKDRPTLTPNMVFVVASHYQSLQIIVLLLQACLLEIYLFCGI